MGLAFLMDLIVWYKANRIDIDPESGASSASMPHGGMAAELLSLSADP